MGFFSRLFKEEEPVLPSASDAQKRTMQYVSRTYVISNIDEAIFKGCYTCTFKGLVSDELKQELENSGYMVEPYISDRDYQCTEISWKK